MTELRIRPVFEEQISALLVVEDAAEPVAESGCREPWRDARLADRVHVGALLDEQLKQRVPAAIRRAEERVLAIGGRAAAVSAQLQQEANGGQCLSFKESESTRITIEPAVKVPNSS